MKEIIINLLKRVACLEQEKNEKSPSSLTTRFAALLNKSDYSVPTTPLPSIIIPVANLGSKIEYRNKKNKWISAWVIACDLTQISWYIVQNIHGLQLSVCIDEMRLVPGSVVFIPASDNIQCGGGDGLHEATFYGQQQDSKTNELDGCNHTLYSMTINKIKCGNNCNCVGKVWASMREMSFITTKVPYTSETIVHRYQFLVEYLSDNSQHVLSCAEASSARNSEKYSVCLNAMLSNRCKEKYGVFTELEVLTGLKVVGVVFR
jgi:hypothetical protein